MTAETEWFKAQENLTYVTEILAKLAAYNDNQLKQDIQVQLYNCKRWQVLSPLLNLVVRRRFNELSQDVLGLLHAEVKQNKAAAIQAARELLKEAADEQRP